MFCDNDFHKVSLSVKISVKSLHLITISVKSLFLTRRRTAAARRARDASDASAGMRHATFHASCRLALHADERYKREKHRERERVSERERKGERERARACEKERETRQTYKGAER